MKLTVVTHVLQTRADLQESHAKEERAAEAEVALGPRGSQAPNLVIHTPEDGTAPWEEAGNDDRVTRGIQGEW